MNLSFKMSFYFKVHYLIRIKVLSLASNWLLTPIMQKQMVDSRSLHKNIENVETSLCKIALEKVLKLFNTITNRVNLNSVSYTLFLLQ